MNALILRSALVGIAILVVTATTSRATAADPVLMTYKLQVDSPLVYSTSRETQYSLHNGRSVTNQTSQDVSVANLAEVDAQGNYQFLWENKSLSVNRETRSGERRDYLVHDSVTEESSASGPGSKLMVAIFSALDGSTLTITMSPEGRVLGIDGVNEMFAEIFAGMPQAAQYVDANRDSMKTQMADLCIELSDQPVSPGDSWSSAFDVSIPNVANTTAVRNCELVGYEVVDGRRVARVDYSTSGTIDLASESGGKTVTGQLRFSGTGGTLLFDPEAGVVVRNESMTRLSGDLIVGDSTIPMVSTSKFNATLLGELPQ